MKQPIKIGIIGDFNPDNASHLATDDALQHAASSLSFPISIEWLPTVELERDAAAMVQPFNGLWCSPGSPYVSMDGALSAIQIAREQHIPFIGT